jgi:antitoxin MazE
MSIQCRYMKTTIINIGNSKGIRIPKPLLNESGIEKDVEISVKKGEIKIVPIKKINTNAFAKASEASFAEDWLRPEEEDAWKIYQSDK